MRRYRGFLRLKRQMWHHRIRQYRDPRRVTIECERLTAADFAAEARRQGTVVAASYAADADAQWWLDHAEEELAAFYRDER